VSGIKSIFVDTNILVYFLEGRSQLSIYSDNNFIISSITEVEFLGVRHIQGLPIQKRQRLIKECMVLPFDEAVKDLAIQVKRQTNLKTPDAIIAATAINYRIPLLTADKDFKKVPDLSLLLLEI
jgi:predicted nucleic acid-binding protein